MSRCDCWWHVGHHMFFWTPPPHERRVMSAYCLQLIPLRTTHNLPKSKVSQSAQSQELRSCRLCCVVIVLARSWATQRFWNPQ
jgi:hypothetical protein